MLLVVALRIRGGARFDKMAVLNRAVTNNQLYRRYRRTESDSMNKIAGATVLTIMMLFLGIAVAQEGPESVLRGTKEFRRSVLISGLSGPWALLWGPDNMLWVTERTGKRISRIDPVSGQKRVAITIDEVSAPGAQD